jgi:hypothetical protein
LGLYADEDVDGHKGSDERARPAKVTAPPIPQNNSRTIPREANEPGITPQFLVNEQVVDNTVHAEALMKLLGIPSGASADAGMERIKLYNSWRKIYAKKTAQDRELAAEKAIAGEVPA